MKLDRTWCHLRAIALAVGLAPILGALLSMLVILAPVGFDSFAPFLPTFVYNAFVLMTPFALALGMIAARLAITWGRTRSMQRLRRRLALAGAGFGIAAVAAVEALVLTGVLPLRVLLGETVLVLRAQPGLLQVALPVAAVIAAAGGITGAICGALTPRAMGAPFRRVIGDPATPIPPTDTPAPQVS